MAENSKIEWTDHTFNPWMGCTKVHAGCTNCYAETLMDERWGKVQWGPNGTRVVASDASWKNPLKWNKAAALNHASHIGETRRPRVFCASLADIFEDWQGPLVNAKGNELRTDPISGLIGDGPQDEYSRRCGVRPLTMADLRARLFALIDATPYLDWLILTKRPENVLRMWPNNSQERAADLWGKPGGMNAGLCRPNVWLLTSVSNQETADKQIPELLKCRDLVPVLGLSCEPLLGPINLRKHIGFLPTKHLSRVRGIPIIDWVIVGGESGHGARPCNLNWVDDIRDQCAQAEVSCFIKQLGEHPIGSHAERMAMVGESVSGEDATVRWKLHDKKGGDWNEWPAGLKVRQFPAR